MRGLIGHSLLLAVLLACLASTSLAQPAALQGEAHRHSQAAFAAVARGDLAAAEAALSAARRLAPEHPQLLRQWADLKRRQEHWDAAIAAWTQLIEQAPGDPWRRLERAFVRHAAGHHAGALDDFDAALAAGLDGDPHRTAVLGSADAALALDMPERALAALQPLLASDDFDVHARHAMALRAHDRQEQAIAAWRHAEQVSADPAQQVTAIRSRAQIFRDIGRDADGHREILDGVGRYPDNRALMLDAAYLAVAAGDDQAAHARFAVGAAGDEAPPHALVDAAYVAHRLGESREAAQYFRRTIDRYRQAPPDERPFDVRQWFGMRRQVQEIERSFGFQAALFHRGGVFLPGVGGDDVLQASVEAFWQPPAIGYRGGRILQAFVRGIETLDAPGLERPSETRFGSVGVRYKPIGRANLVVTAERVFGIGDLVDDDWLLRAGYSHDIGVDLQPWNRSWTTLSGYVEAVRFIEAERSVIGGQLRLGRSFAFGSEAWVVIPHLSLLAEHDSAAAHRNAAAIGPGVALRRWFRGDEHWAPASHVELQLHYRARIAGDDRAEGVAAQLVLYY